MLKAILFDLDGTLLDSFGLLLTGYKHAVKQVLGVETRDEDWIPLIGLPLLDQMSRFSKEKAPEMVNVYRQFYGKHHDEFLRIYPGVREVVEEFYRRGFKQAAVTSKKTLFAQRGVDLFGLGGFFETVIGEDDVENHKPAPDPVQCALDRLAVRPEEALMVGDSPYDVLSARAAGVRSVGALWGTFSHDRLLASKPDFLLERIEDLLPLAEQLRAEGSAGK